MSGRALDDLNCDIVRTAPLYLFSNCCGNNELISRKLEQLTKPLRERKISGEALAAGRSATLQLLLRILRIDYERIDLFLGQCQQEISPVHPGNLRRSLLRHLAA